MKSFDSKSEKKNDVTSQQFKKKTLDFIMPDRHPEETFSTDKKTDKDPQFNAAGGKQDAVSETADNAHDLQQPGTDAPHEEQPLTKRQQILQEYYNNHPLTKWRQHYQKIKDEYYKDHPLTKQMQHLQEIKEAYYKDHPLTKQRQHYQELKEAYYKDHPVTKWRQHYQKIIEDYYKDHPVTKQRQHLQEIKQKYYANRPANLWVELLRQEEPAANDQDSMPAVAVSQPNDPEELEADKKSEEVASPLTSQEGINQQDGATEQVAAKQLLRQEEDTQEDAGADKKELAAQRNEAGEIPVAAETKDYIKNLSGGEPLSDSERSFFEPRFQADFSEVKVHDDTGAHHAAKGINAKAFTLGNNIVFGKGQYQPDTTEGKKLMAHELTHVVQQGKYKGNRKKIQRQRTRSESDPGWDETYTSAEGVYVMNEPNERYIGIIKKIGTTVLVSRYLKAVIHGRTYLHVKVPEGAYDYTNQQDPRGNLEGWILAATVKDTQWETSPRAYIKVGSSWPISFKQNGKEYSYVYTVTLYAGKPFSRHNNIFLAPDKRNPSMVDLKLTRFVDGEKQKDDYTLRIESLSSSWQNINLLKQSQELQKIFDMGFADKMKDLEQAIKLSEKYFKPAFERVFKEFSVDILQALWDFFKAALYVYGIALLAGVAIGAVLAGVLSGGTAIPAGIAAGAQLGNTFGLAAIEFLGMFYTARLIVLIGKPTVLALGDFIITAWNAHHDEKKLDAAAKSFAEGMAILAYVATLFAVAILVKQGIKGFSQSTIGTAAWQKVETIKAELKGKAQNTKLVKKLDEILKNSEQALKQGRKKTTNEQGGEGDKNKTDKIKMYEYKDKLYKRILNTFKKKKAVLPEELADLMKHTKNGMKIDKLPTPQELNEFAQKSQVEWGISSNGVKYISHGTQKNVIIKVDLNSTKYVAHVHFKNPYPSAEDILLLVTMKEKGAPIHDMVIILNGKPMSYNFTLIDNLIDKEKITNVGMSSRDFTILKAKLKMIIHKHYK